MVDFKKLLFPFISKQMRWWSEASEGFDKLSHSIMWSQVLVSFLLSLLEKPQRKTPGGKRVKRVQSPLDSHSPRPEDSALRADFSGLPWALWAHHQVGKKPHYSWSLFPALISVYNYTFISVITWLMCVSIAGLSAQRGSLLALYCTPSRSATR